MTLSCGSKTDVDKPATTFELPNYPESSQTIYSSEYAPAMGYMLDHAQADLKVQGLTFKYRQLTLLSNADLSSVQQYYDGEFTNSGFTRDSDIPLAESGLRLWVWNSGSRTDVRRVHVGCLKTKDKPCGLLMLAWGTSATP